MLKNYLKTGLRNLWKNKGYSTLNIVGLAVGLATCMLIMLYTTDELSFDAYHQKASRIYRINNDVKFGGNHIDLAVTPAPEGAGAVRELPEAEQYCRIAYYGSGLIKTPNGNLREKRIAWADSTLFNVFTFTAISGDLKTALRAPHSMVINEKTAMKYFNRTNVAGETLVLNDSIPYKVTAVIENMPAQSHFHYDIFVTMTDNQDSRTDNWVSENYSTYLVLRPGTSVERFTAELDRMMDRHAGPQLKSMINLTMEEFKKNGDFIHNSLTPVTDIHLRSNKTEELEANGSIQYVYIFTLIAIFILVIACVNFMNLSTARSANRAKEVGVRKVLGSLRNNLIGQFLAESFLISLIATVFALLLAWLMLPYFNSLSGKEIAFGTFFQSKMLITLLILVPVVALLAGSYPAFYLSAFQPIDVLKGKLSKGFKKSFLRNALVVFQFGISIVLIIGTIVIYNQLHYIRNKDIGFNRGQVLVIKGTDALNTQINAFKNEVKQLPGVTDLTVTGYLPVDGYRSQDAFFTSPAMDSKTAISMQNWVVDEHYVPTLSLQVVQGRNFSEQFKTDSGAILVNEAAAKFLGGNVLHRKLYEIQDISPKVTTRVMEIIGVVKNFNFHSLRDVITPLTLKLGLQTGSIALQLNAGNNSALLDRIKNKWQVMAPGQPFDYEFMDEQFNKLYITEQHTGQLFQSFAVLAIFIACLGLFGLAAYAAEQRTREIGIRKVLGASTGKITGMLSAEFVKLVIVSAIIAFPVAWWAMTKWLQDFAYRVDISWWIFAVAGIAALLVALITVSFQALRAALANPVKSLRSE